MIYLLVFEPLNSVQSPSLRALLALDHHGDSSGLRKAVYLLVIDING